MVFANYFVKIYITINCIIIIFLYRRQQISQMLKTEDNICNWTAGSVQVEADVQEKLSDHLHLRKVNVATTAGT